MGVTLDDYIREGYEEVGLVSDRDLYGDFVKNTLHRHLPLSLIYHGAVIMTLILLVMLPVLSDAYTTFSDRYLVQVAAGFLLGLLLIPVHELLHGIYLKILGAKEIDYDFKPSKMQAQCYSDLFVMSWADYRRFALVPFIIFTVFSLLCLSLMPNYTALFLAILLLQISTTAGDFALVAYGELLALDDLHVYYNREAQELIFLSR